MNLLEPIESCEVKLLTHPHESSGFLSVVVDLVHCLLLAFMDLKSELVFTSTELDLPVVDERSLGEPHLG